MLSARPSLLPTYFNPLTPTRVCAILQWASVGGDFVRCRLDAWGDHQASSYCRDQLIRCAAGDPSRSQHIPNLTHGTPYHLTLPTQPTNPTYHPNLPSQPKPYHPNLVGTLRATSLPYSRRLAYPPVLSCEAHMRLVCQLVSSRSPINLTHARSPALTQSILHPGRTDPG